MGTLAMDTSNVTVRKVVSDLGLQVVAGNEARLAQEITGGYASDLLSCVMAGAGEGNVWVTLQAHPNVIAVADLLNLTCVVITEGTQPDEETVGRAQEKGIPVLLSTESTFAVVSRLAQLGVQAGG